MKLAEDRVSNRVFLSNNKSILLRKNKILAGRKDNAENMAI